MSNNEFKYTYSAKEQEEIKKIREKYLKKSEREENKIEKLRRLDERVVSRATMISLIVGIVSALVLGIGMSLIMTDIGIKIGIIRGVSVFLGVLIGISGLTGTIFAYPLYNVVIKTEREKIAPEILRLTDELMK